MGGQLAFGDDVFIVTHETSVIELTLLEDVGIVTVIDLTQQDFDVTLTTDEVKEIELLQTDFDVTLQDASIAVTAVLYPAVLNEYEQTLMMLYQQYGFATVADRVFNSLEELVNVELPEGTAGII